MSPSPRPLESPERLQFRYWMHYAEGSAMPPLLMTLIFGRIRGAPMPFFAKPIARAIVDKAMAGFVGPQLAAPGLMEQSLQAREWFAGERFTAADIQMSFPVQAAAARGGGLESYPRLRAFLARIEARPAYQAALKKGGPFALMGRKPAG